MNRITTKVFQGINVRVVTEEDGTLKFVMKDVAEALGYKLATEFSKLINDKYSGMAILNIRSESGVEQKRQMLTVTEPGLYQGLAKSQQLKAEAFQDWLYEDVLPSIRQTGGYQAEQKPMTSAEQLLQSAQWMVSAEQKLAQIPVLTDKIEKIEEQVKHNEHIFHRGDYTSIKAYTNTMNITLDLTQAKKAGRVCVKQCGLQGMSVKKLPCPYFGEINSYPVWIIEDTLEVMGLLEG